MKAIKLATPRQRTQRGATIIEYVLIAALLSIAAIATLGTLGTEVSNKFQNVSDAIPA